MAQMRRCRKCNKVNHLESGIDLCYYCGIKNCTTWKPKTDWDVCHFFTGQVYCEGTFDECKQFIEEHPRWFKVVFIDHDYKAFNVELLDAIEWKPFVASSN